MTHELQRHETHDATRENEIEGSISGTRAKSCRTPVCNAGVPHRNGEPRGARDAEPRLMRAAAPLASS